LQQNQQFAVFHVIVAPVREALQTTALGQNTGPKKPVLVRAFRPMGYDCQAASGTFTLRRRTPGNLTVEISLDVGTWSRSLTAFFQSPGTRLPRPATTAAVSTRGGRRPVSHRRCGSLAATGG